MLWALNNSSHHGCRDPRKHHRCSSCHSFALLLSATLLEDDSPIQVSIQHPLTCFQSCTNYTQFRTFYYLLKNSPCSLAGNPCSLPPVCILSTLLLSSQSGPLVSHRYLSALACVQCSFSCSLPGCWPLHIFKQQKCHLSEIFSEA